MSFNKIKKCYMTGILAIASTLLASSEPTTFSVAVSNVVSGTMTVMPLTFQATSNSVGRIAEGRVTSVQILPIPEPKKAEEPDPPKTPFEELLDSIQVPAIQFEEMSISNAFERLTQTITAAWGKQDIEINIFFPLIDMTVYRYENHECTSGSSVPSVDPFSPCCATPPECIAVRWGEQPIQPFEIQATNVWNVLRQFVEKMRVHEEKTNRLIFRYYNDASTIVVMYDYGECSMGHRIYSVPFALQDGVIERLDEIRAQFDPNHEIMSIKEFRPMSKIVVVGYSEPQMKFEVWLKRLIDELSTPESFEFLLCGDTLFLKGFHNGMLAGLWRYHVMKDEEGTLCERFEPCFGQDEPIRAEMAMIGFHGDVFALHTNDGRLFKLSGNEFISTENEGTHRYWTLPPDSEEENKKTLEQLLSAMIIDEINFQQSTTLKEAVDIVQSVINKAGTPTNDVRIVVNVSDENAFPGAIRARAVSAINALEAIASLCGLKITYPAPNEIQLSEIELICSVHYTVSLPKALCDAFPTTESWNNALSSFFNQEDFVRFEFDASFSTNRMLEMITHTYSPVGYDFRHNAPKAMSPTRRERRSPDRHNEDAGQETGAPGNSRCPLRHCCRSAMTKQSI